MQTASGKVLTVTVAYRLPLPAHQRALAQAECEGIRLSEVLRRATLRGLEAGDRLARVNGGDSDDTG